MPNAQDVQCANLLHSALGSTIGICIKTNNPLRARTALYQARSLLGDVEMQSLSIRVSPNDSEGELWIIKPHAGPTFDMALPDLG